VTKKDVNNLPVSTQNERENFVEEGPLDQTLNQSINQIPSTDGIVFTGNSLSTCFSLLFFIQNTFVFQTIYLFVTNQSSN